mgnify:CR=1 FL=1
MSNEIDKSIDTKVVINGIHAHWREWDRRLWQSFVDGSEPDRNILVDVPDVIKAHPLYEECQPGDEAARLDVETGAYEAIRKVEAGNIVLDIGAHVGYFARKALAAGAWVVAIEPDPRNFRILSRLLIEYPQQLLVYPFAAGESAGLVELHRSLFSTQHHLHQGIGWPGTVQESVTVPQLPVDSIMVSDLGNYDPIAFIKIDVEESELAVLRGLERTLRHARPFVVVEVSVDMPEIAEYMIGLGYTIQVQKHIHQQPAPMVTPAAGLWHCTPKEESPC